ncbi:MAG: PilC/PilY family type IV pilus protein [Acinetobacter sp.]
MKPTLASFKRNQLWHAVCVGSLTSTWLIASSVVQAGDLQIYAVPESGKKTIVMMLDTSGSMDNYDNCEAQKTASYSEAIGTETIQYTRRSTTSRNCSTGQVKYDRLTRLKDGMMALLNSDNAELPRVRVGLGHYSTNTSNTGNKGDGKTGVILVAAKPLGAPNSAQRVALKKAIAGLVYSAGTPTAHAYAEAASYLMGTSTYKNVVVNGEKYQRRVRKSDSQTKYKTCDTFDLTALDGTCSGWSDDWSSSQPSDITDLNNYQRTDSDRNYDYFFYKKSETLNFSGIGHSRLKDTTSNPDIVMNRTSTDANAQYKTPLSDAEDRQSCDGQGVYILSDGEANASGTGAAKSVMQAALTDAYSTNFECGDALIDANGNSSASAMNCMANFAKKLFNPDTNPTGVSIKTAFVGFGSEMSDLDKWHVKSSCQWSSRAYNDPITKTAPNDKCSPGSGDLAVPRPTSQTGFDGGYGNGGFFIASTDAEVTNSVIQFIRNLGAAPLAPLTTGTIAVPYDSLDPKSLQTTGYLRAMEPNPASSSLTWRGNLKKYESILTGDNAGAFGDKSGSLVYDSKGNFEKSTKDHWNGTVKVDGTDYSYNDGGNIEIGGVRWNMPMPALGQREEKKDGEYVKYTYSSSGNVRNFYTDAGAYDSATSTVATISGSKTGAALLKIPTSPKDDYGKVPADSASHILTQFGSDTIIKNYPALLKRKLLNYLGFNLELTTDALPATLTVPNAPYFSMGGIVHSYPVQLTYSGTLDDKGDLTAARDRSVLFGTMEGGLHIVNAETGVEESVFVPAELLNDTVKSKALSAIATDAVAPSHGMDGAWVADPAYKMETTKSGTVSTTKVTARRMNVYGGMRMGGNSYFGMDVLDPKNPKLLFRINNTVSGFEDMGQSWSKPVLASVRFGGKIKRVMIVGGGYDQCYENPSFKLGGSGLSYPSGCNGRDTAKGNAVYIVDAEDGSLIWSATYNSSANAADGAKYLKHSIVSRISTLDRNSDGLVDHLYFGDLGGQVFRIDLNNNAADKSTLGKRVVRLANLASAITDTGYIATSSNTYLDENAPRLYEPVTVTIHDQGSKTFILVGAASGDRSTPLDVAPLEGREGMLPATALSSKPANNVYGIIDNDFALTDLITGTPTLTTVNKTMADLVRNPQILPEDVTSVIGRFFSADGGALKHGWYRSLSSLADGTEKAGGAFRREGGLKAYEEPMALTGHLMVSVYDPEGTGVTSNDPCNPRIVGETDWQKFCLPFGVCLNSDGSINSSKEKDTGLNLDNAGNNANVLGSGIRGITLVGKGGGTGTGQCGKLTMAGNIKGTGEWQCTSHFIPTRWYERYR